MIDYTPIENAVLLKIISHFSDELNATRCRAADVDTVFISIFEEDSKYGCYIDYNGGSDQPRKPFRTDVWAWSISGVFLIRYTETADTDVRMIINKLPHMFDSDHTVGGVSPYVHVVSMGNLEPGNVNDKPFYFLPFMIEALDR